MESHSETLADLASALVKAQAAFPNIDLDGTGQVGQNRNYKYATLAHIIKTVTPVLTANGLSVVQTCEPGAPGNVRVTTTLLHQSGQFLEGTLEMPAGNTAQQAGSAMTYARRYSLAAILGIAAAEDDDGAEASRTRTSTTPRARTEPPAAAARHRQQQPRGGRGEVTAGQAAADDWSWFWATVRDEYHADSATVHRLLGVKSIKEDMAEQQLSTILTWIGTAQLKAKTAGTRN